MKNRKTKRIAALLLCGALISGTVLFPTSARAADPQSPSKETTIKGTGKIQVQSEGFKTAKVNGDSGALNSAIIPIKAETAGAEIVYDILVEYGDMKFKYSYGRTWNPELHKYSGGNAGWDPENLNGTNNIITVTNNSNFPMKASFSADSAALATAFNNADPSPSNPVKGCFADDNDAFKNNIAKLNDGSYPGDTTTSFTLEMDVGSLTSGDTYYQKGNVAGTPVSKSVYFALCGRPDKEVEANSEVGSITVTIAPESGVTEKTKT